MRQPRLTSDFAKGIILDCLLGKMAAEGSASITLSRLPTLESLADRIQWFTAHGFMTEKVSVDRVADLSFLR